MSQAKKKIIVILGTTSSGKTRQAVKLANGFNGEVVSADSRQVYKGMDIGTGKDLSEYILPPDKGGIRGVLAISSKPPLTPPYPSDAKALAGRQGENKISYHLIDVVSPKKQFDLASYQKLAFKAIDDILKRGKLPILTGGSGLYLQAVVDNYKLSSIKKDLDLREKAETASADELFGRLKNLAPKVAARLNQSDKNNKRRLVRYLEILEQDKNFKTKTGRKLYDALIIGLETPREILKERIAKRLIYRLKEQNLIGEVEGLHNRGLSWKRLEAFGLEYKFVSLYLQKQLSYEEMVEKLTIALNQFSKRQLTWFKRWEKQGAKINWLDDEEKIRKLVEKFLK